MSAAQRQAPQVDTEVGIPDEALELAEAAAGKLAELSLKYGVDIMAVHREVLGRALSQMLDAELSDHLGYDKGAVPPVGQANRRNGSTTKTVRTGLGPVKVRVVRDRDATFEPKITPKYGRSLGEFEHKILVMYGRGMSMRDIQRTLREIYGTEVSTEFISRVTRAISEDVEQWRSRPLERVYYVVYIDALYAKTRDNGRVETRAVYTVVGVAEDGHKQVLGLHVAEAESAKVWMGILEDLRNRGVERIGVLASDGLKGISDAVEAVFRDATYQTCIVHLIRSSVRLVPYKDRKAPCADLRKVYTASNENQARTALEDFKHKWDRKYPMVAKKWEQRWQLWTPFLQLPQEARKIIYTTNAIESLHRRLRKVLKTKGAFPSDDALLRALYLAIQDSTQTWGRPSRYWAQARVQLAIHFDLMEE